MKKINNQAGFTLIEVLVSIVILSIVLTTFFSFFSQSLIFSGKNEEKLVAYNLASKTLKIVELRYNNKLSSTQSKIEIYSTNDICSSDLTTIAPNLKWDSLSPSMCYYIENQKKYYPEIVITKLETTDFTSPTLFTINIKVFNSPKSDVNRKLLSETFGYMRGMQ